MVSAFTLTHGFNIAPDLLLRFLSLLSKSQPIITNHATLLTCSSYLCSSSSLPLFEFPFLSLREYKRGESRTRVQILSRSHSRDTLRTDTHRPSE
ncbi:unnamed protein product [Leuciscus chuanchicus]